ncbi:MAG: lactate dehydrogenase [Nitrososphaeria archaeon]|nr:lactate dehydrogenase [Nitrosopumilaceae archaeon]NIP09186.1 lactate dehydrogenase [Nitrosopumilaceae archaeon]NIP91715.1 lactate dehydrogenase [Nitrososphaeria archaeon]NIS95554.1 lactate dehydrogenase [Nitrosopumilaceae archaeon]
MISIIGSGLVGSSIAFLCAVNSLDDIVLLNRTKSKALGEALDIANAIPKNSDITIKGTDDYSEISNSKLIVIAASTGIYLKSRNEMVEAQVEMIKNIGKNIKEKCSSPLTLIVSNPVDVLTYYFQKETNLPRTKVMGIASSLDTSRFRLQLSKSLQIRNSQISDAIVLGEHGDSMVPIFSKVKINGDLGSKRIDPKIKDKVWSEIRDYWIALRNYKSRSQFGIAKNTFDVIEAITKNQEISIPASVMLDGEYEEKDVCMGVPVTINENGISKIQEIDLDQSEQNLFKLSANTIRENIKSI